MPNVRVKKGQGPLNNFQITHAPTTFYPLMIKEPSKRLNASLHLIIIIWTNFNCPFPASLLKLNSGLNGQMFDHHLVSSFPANNSPTLGGLYKLIYCNDFILCFANYCLQGRTHILHALGIEILLFTASLAHGG